MPIAPQYNPKDYEENIYKIWQDNGVGLPEKQTEQQGTTIGTHSILMPPPNLTGNLHAGHSFQHFLMDTLSRINRQKGKSNLWFPGVDHAGLQLEGVVDKLIKKGDFNDNIIQKTNQDGEITDLIANNKEELPKVLKARFPEVWLECAWQKVELWRDNQRNQATVLGDTPDYSRQLFTLDKRACDMVFYAFKAYWQDDLLHKNSYLINWSVGLQTALSDVAGEIEYVTRADPFVTFEYRFDTITNAGFESNTLLDRFTDLLSHNPLLVSTVRPETIFGDVAVAIHPEKFAFLLNEAGFNSNEIVELAEAIKSQKIQCLFGIKELGVSKVHLILAEEVEKDFGTGALKITPASDLVDFTIFNTYIGGEFPQSVGRDGNLTSVCGTYAGLSTEVARLVVIKDMLFHGYIPAKTAVTTEQKAELFASLSEFDPRNYSYEEGIKLLREMCGDSYEINWNYEHNVSICERTKTVIEPLISEEFFVRFNQKSPKTDKTLQEHGLEGIGQTVYFSDEYKQRGADFVENIKDWCISRSLLWGHRIPVWYNIKENPDMVFYTYSQIQQNPALANKIFVGSPEEFAAFVVDKNPEDWKQEIKILDTWFSSCLWPLTTLNFYEYIKTQDSTVDFARYYPTQEMTTAKEIFYIWIVRMTMLAKYFTSRELPIDHVLHNTIPFQNVIITPTVLDEKGRKMSKSLGNGLDPVEQIAKYSSDSLRLAMLSGMIPNRNMRLGGNLADNLCEKYRNFGNKLWNVARFLESKRQLDTTTSELAPASMWILYKFNVLLEALEKHEKVYELSHSVSALYRFLWDDFATWYVEYLKTDTSQAPFAVALLRQFVVYLSPFAPFETEVLWKEVFGETQLLAFKTLETHIFDEYIIDQNKVAEFEKVIVFIESVRSTRGLFALDPALALEVEIEDSAILAYASLVKIMAHTELFNPINPNHFVVKTSVFSFSLDIYKFVKDIPKEKARTTKLIESLNKQVMALNNQLANTQFIQQADEEVITQKKEDLAARTLELENQQSKLQFLQQPLA